MIVDMFQNQKSDTPSVFGQESDYTPEDYQVFLAEAKAFFLLNSGKFWVRLNGDDIKTRLEANKALLKVVMDGYADVRYCARDYEQV